MQTVSKIRSSIRLKESIQNPPGRTNRDSAYSRILAGLGLLGKCGWGTGDDRQGESFFGKISENSKFVINNPVVCFALIVNDLF